MSRRAAHKHSAEHVPAAGSGYAVCICGATQRVEHGRRVGDWHTCHRCVSET